MELCGGGEELFKIGYVYIGSFCDKLTQACKLWKNWLDNKYLGFSNGWLWKMKKRRSYYRSLFMNLLLREIGFWKFTSGL